MIQEVKEGTFEVMGEPRLIKELASVNEEWRYNEGWEYETDIHKGLYSFAHEEHPDEMYVQYISEEFRPVYRFIDPFAGEQVLKIYADNFDDLCALTGEERAIDVVIETIDRFCWDDAGKHDVEEWEIQYLRGEGELPRTFAAE